MSQLALNAYYYPLLPPPPRPVPHLLLLPPSFVSTYQKILIIKTEKTKPQTKRKQLPPHNRTAKNKKHREGNKMGQRVEKSKAETGTLYTHCTSYTKKEKVHTGEYDKASEKEKVNKLE